MVNRFSVGINTLTNNGYSVNVDGDWATKGHLSQGGYRLQQEHRPGELHRVRGLGCRRREWHEAAAIRTEERPDEGPRQPHDQDRTDLRPPGSQRLRASRRSPGRQASAGGRPRCQVPTSQLNGGGSSMASFLLGWVNNGGTEQIREVRQRYPYYAMYAPG